MSVVFGNGGLNYASLPSEMPTVPRASMPIGESTPTNAGNGGGEGVVLNASKVQLSNGATSGTGTNAAGSTLIEQLNQKLYPQGLQAVFQYDNKAHMTWLNVVNKATGQVVDRFPPEKIREMVDAAANAGLSYDKRL